MSGSRQAFLIVTTVFFSHGWITERCLGQTSAVDKSVKRAVGLEIILSCADDALIQEIFDTDLFTAEFRLSAVNLIDKRHQPGANLADLAPIFAKGFETSILEKTRILVMPTDGQGHIVADSKLPFCHYSPVAQYDPDPKSDPRTITISGDNWVFNSSELFAHADQFHFESGVFDDSSEVYFSASKGHVLIQFICKSDGLKLHRVVYAKAGWNK